MEVNSDIQTLFNGFAGSCDGTGFGGRKRSPGCCNVEHQCGDDGALVAALSQVWRRGPRGKQAATSPGCYRASCVTGCWIGQRPPSLCSDWSRTGRAEREGRLRPGLGARLVSGSMPRRLKGTGRRWPSSPRYAVAGSMPRSCSINQSTPPASPNGSSSNSVQLWGRVTSW